jgi:ABC-type nitrate/sulfonate/bicarbonate transport system permease component
MSAGRSRALGLIVPAVALICWQVLAQIQVLPDFLVAPTVIGRQWWTMAVSGELWEHMAKSIKLVTAGFLFGSAAGMTIGLLAGVFGPVESFSEPIVSLTYPVPKVVFLPLIFAWFGLGDTSKILIIIASVFYPVYIASYYGAKSVKTVHIWSALNMGASRSQIIRRVVVPSALPQVFSGLRIGLALAFILMVTSELVVANQGLGYLIARSEQSLRFDIMFVAIITIGLVGFFADRILLRTRDWLLVGQVLGTEERRD